MLWGSVFVGGAVARVSPCRLCRGGAVLWASLVAARLGTGGAGGAVTSVLLAVVVCHLNALAPACAYQLLVAGRAEKPAGDPGPPEA